MARRLHYEDAPLQPGELPLGRALRHYAFDVLRLAPGTSVVLFDGAGQQAEAVLHKDTLSVARVEPAVEPSAHLTLACAIPKGERADWLVEKTCELGLGALHWLRCARSVVAQASVARHARWERLAAAAARQSGRSRVPTLHPAVPLETFLTQTQSMAASRWVAHPGSAVARPGGGPHLAVVGPEGGLSKAELQALAAAGYTAVALSHHILRVETAAVCAAALLLAPIGPTP
jgi:16S rRNA (uracil1498-N3)-methyltransferase